MKYFNLIRRKDGFITVEIINLLLILAITTSLFVGISKFLRLHLIKESWVTAIYLLDGALNASEYKGEHGILLPPLQEENITLGNWQYLVTIRLVEDKPGLATLYGKVMWQREKYHFDWEVQRKILYFPKGHFPHGSNDSTTHNLPTTRHNSNHE